MSGKANVVYNQVLNKHILYRRGRGSDEQQTGSEIITNWLQDSGGLKCILCFVQSLNVKWNKIPYAIIYLEVTITVESGFSTE